MTTLLLDIGNSRAKSARLIDGQLDSGPVMALGGHHADAEHESSAMTFEWLESVMPVDRIVVASVGGAEREAALRSAALSNGWPVPEFVVTESRACGVECGYRDPSHMGVDRWLAVIAAWHHVAAPVCVVDAGTALTVDLVDDCAKHLGGLIVPGMRMMAEAIYAGTRVPRIAPSGPPDEVPGRDTGDAVSQGARVAALGAVRETLSWQPVGARPAVIVLAGGDAEQLLSGLQRHSEVIVMPDLVLRGLAAYAAAC